MRRAFWDLRRSLRRGCSGTAATGCESGRTTRSRRCRFAPWRLQSRQRRRGSFGEKRAGGRRQRRRLQHEFAGCGVAVARGGGVLSRCVNGAE